MDRKRPDYEGYLARLGLPCDASPLDVLSGSGGEQQGDSVYLAEEPHVAYEDRQRQRFSFAARATQFGSIPLPTVLRVCDRVIDQ